MLSIAGCAHNAAIGNSVLDPGVGMLAEPFATDALVDKIRPMAD